MKKKTVKIIGSIILIGAIIGISTGLYLFFKPHRNVSRESAYAQLKVQDLVNEFTADAAKANAKYLSSDGNSKILIIEGRIHNISTNQNGEPVILLKDDTAKVGVSASFNKASTVDIASLKTGDMIKVKGAITAGNRYDADLDLYEHAVLIQCSIVK